MPAADGLAERVRRDPRPRRRATSGSARPASASPPAGATCRARWCSRRAGARAAAGWSSATSLLIGPWHHANDRSHTHRRTPTDYDADHVLLRTVRCVNGEVQLGLACEPAFDYGRSGRTGSTARTATTSRSRAPPGSDVELRMTTDLNLGIEGPRFTARHLIKEGETLLLRAVVERAPRAAHLRRGLRAARLDRAPLAALARPRRVPRPSVARRPAALGAHAQGADLRADRRDRRGRDHLAARDARRRAQLGLPLLAGSATRRSRSGACTRSASTGRRTTSSTSSPTWPRPADGGLQIMYGIDGRAELPERDARPPHGLRGRAPGPDRQRRPLAGPARRLGRGARLRLPAHQVARLAARERLADARPPGRAGDRELAQARPRDLGGARRAEALHLLQADVLGRARPRVAARRAARGLGPRDRAGARWPTRSTPTSASTRSTSAACSPSTTTPTRSTRRCC